MLKKTSILAVSFLTLLFVSGNTVSADEADLSNDEVIVEPFITKSVRVSNWWRSSYQSHSDIPSTWRVTRDIDGLPYTGTLYLERAVRNQYGRYDAYYGGTLTWNGRTPVD